MSAEAGEHPVDAVPANGLNGVAGGAGSEVHRDPDTVLRQVLEKVRANADRGGIKLQPLEASGAAPESNGENTKGLRRTQLEALHVMSNLCKVSSQDASAEHDPHMRLSLELIRDMLQQCGPQLKAIEPVNEVMKDHLCPPLVKICMTGPAIFVLSLQILVVLIKGFRDVLKVEVGIFLDQIVLRILDSGGSTYQHKYRVLQVLYKLCADSPAALEVFLNFDCDESESNLFERIIDCLAKIAQGKYAGPEFSSLIQPHQEQELQTLAFKSLVKLVGSLVEWSKQMAPQEASVADTAGRRTGNEDNDTDAGIDDDAKSDSTLNTAYSGGATSFEVVKRKQRKREMQIAVSKFNLKPKKGLEHLKRYGFIGDSPESLSAFLKRPDVGLDKTTIGDFLGELKPFNISVMNHLVDSMDFVNLELDGALRAFLSVFRLPGEAQKVERLMEKFAEKYCADNPAKFSNTDCAFVLSFAIIMLQTDIHNPGVKNKMTKEQFISNNRGIDSGQNLPREYLEGIYDSVLANPFTLKEDDALKARLDLRNAKGAAQKVELFAKETQHMVKTSKELMEKRKSSTGAYILAQSTKYVGPFFEAICWPMLATLSVLLEMHDDQAQVDLCMEGFTHCTRIAARNDMDTERDAIVSSLAKFTFLTTIKEMRQKNIDCVKALLVLGLSEGNFLGPSWQYVLFCISQLERLHLLKNRTREDHQVFSDELRQSGSFSNGLPGQVRKRRAYGTGINALVSVGAEDAQVELVNSESVMAQIDVAQIDLLFNRSPGLSSAAIVHFVTQLTRVSREELGSIDQPRIFALQKLVEVADYNMNRIPLVWSRIWHVLSQHFVEAAMHPNIHVGIYALDSLRQLSFKFLERDEICDFQGEFLHPFVTVMTKTQSNNKEVREMAMQSIANTVHQRITHLRRSGWKTVFRILRAGSKECDSEVVHERTFSVLETVITQHYEVFVENFVDGVCALSAVGQCKASTALSHKAISHLVQAAEYLARQAVIEGSPSPGTLVEPNAALGVAGHASDDHGGNRVTDWLLVLQGLSALVGDRRPEVRSAAFEAVCDCLWMHGRAAFDEDMWRTVLKGVIKPLFDEVHQQLLRGDATLATPMASRVIAGFQDLPSDHFTRCLPELFPMLAELISVDCRVVRVAVQDIFSNQVAAALNTLPRADRQRTNPR